MGAKNIYITAEGILNLLTHYSDGDVPLDARLLEAGVSAFLGRWIGLKVESNQWRDAESTQDGGLRPLHVRYEGRKVMVWGDGERVEHPEWRDGVEAPRLQ